MVAVFALGIFSKKITPKAGEWGLIGGFLIGMVRLLTNVLTESGTKVMDGAFWEYTSWFWQTNWNKWDVIATLGVVACCAAFYWYFW